MSFVIEKFSIRGLHSTRDYHIPIRDNKIVMVGVNGLGKTTVVNLLYLILSRQWERTLDYAFRSIELSVDGLTYHVEREENSESVADVAMRMRSHFGRFLPAHYTQDLSVYERLAHALDERTGREGLCHHHTDALLPLADGYVRERPPSIFFSTRTPTRAKR